MTIRTDNNNDTTPSAPSALYDIDNTRKGQSSLHVSSNNIAGRIPFSGSQGHQSSTTQRHTMNRRSQDNNDAIDNDYNPIPIASASAVVQTNNNDDNEPDIIVEAVQVPPPSTTNTTGVSSANSSIPARYPTIPIAPITSTTTTIIPPTTTTTTTQSTTSHPPPGVSDGGYWTTIKYHGPVTWVLCSAISIVGIVSCLFPAGIFVLCCPCDDKDVYKVNGRYYDHRGKFIRRA